MSSIKSLWFACCALLLLLNSNIRAGGCMPEPDEKATVPASIQPGGIADQSTEVCKIFRIRRATRRMAPEQSGFDYAWPDELADAPALPAQFPLQSLVFPGRQVSRPFPPSFCAPLHEVIQALHRCHLF